MHYFHSVVLKGEESRQVLFLVGSIGVGKSSIVDKLKRGMEVTDPTHFIDGCPIHEKPSSSGSYQFEGRDFWR